MSLGDDFKSSKKLICPCCKEEVKKYPPEYIKQGKFICLNCKSNISFIRKNEIYIIWEIR